MTAVLGINAYHADSAACLVVDGELVAAVEEERFCRLKHWAGFPREAIAWCLRKGGIGLGEVDHVALNKDPRANMARKLRYTVSRRPSPQLLRERARSARSWLAIDDELRAAYPGEELRARVHRIEHHLAHLASAFLISPYEKAVLVSVDGFGDFVSSAWGLGHGGEVSLDGRVYFPHSLGVFYEALTQYLGFPHYGDEYKVMGLAPYGEPAYVPQLDQVVRLGSDGTFSLDLSFFRHHDRSVGYQWRNTVPQSGQLWSERLAELLGPPRAPDEPLETRHRDIARSVQAVYEQAYFHLLRTLAARYDLPRLCVAGGCGANSVANGKVQDETPFSESFVAPATGDAGGAVGAALLVWQRVATGAPRATDSAYLGPAYGDEEIERTLAAHAAELDDTCRVERIADAAALCDRVADAIAGGDVVGWFQGHLEWGPRALGNRSILGDPRRADMKDILNAKIKRRESFRPFAPSVLREETAEWFETDGDVPYMSKVFQIRPERREQVPAVTHVDGSGRLQTVEREENERYHGLISAFAAKTGVPMVLNTSFNENEPIVNTPEEALDCFLRTSMDVLVLGDTIVSRRAG